MSPGHIEEVVLQFIILPAYDGVKMPVHLGRKYCHSYDIPSTFLSHKTFSDSDTAAA
jgi:ribosomal protein S19